MANPYIPRTDVHEWSETIGADPEAHKAAMTRLLKEQRRLTRFIEENAESMGQGTGQVILYLAGVIARIFELAGGRVRTVTWEQVRAAEARVKSKIPALLPIDEGFTERFREAARAQPHILDEVVLTLFDRPIGPNEPDMVQAEKAKVLFMLWVAVESLDGGWTPAPGFSGEGEYKFHFIEPKPMPAQPGV